MDEELEPFRDLDGFERRAGLIAPDTGMLKAFQASPNAIPEWTDAQIKEVITDPFRYQMRDIFGPEWISDQLQYGSCAGWATVACLDRSRWFAGIHDELMLSGSYVYAWCNNGHDNGSLLSDTLDEIKTYGAPSKQLVPANRIYRSQMPPGADVEALKHQGLIAYPVKTLQGLKTALAQQKFCVVAVHAGSNFQRMNANGVVGVDNGPGNHAVCCHDLLIVDGELAFDIANSWNLSYGDDGFAYLREESFTQTIYQHTFWALSAPQEAEQ